MMTYIWQFRKLPGAKPQFYTQACKCIWLLSLVIITLSNGLQAKLLWKNVLQIACIFSPYFWLMFIVDISRQREKIPLSVKYSLRVIIGCLVLGIISDFWHGMFWPDAWLDGETLKLV